MGISLPTRLNAGMARKMVRTWPGSAGWIPACGQLGVRGHDRAGAGASYRHILTVRGRRTGRARSTPADVVETVGHRWLVAGYGPSSWALNARAAGEVTLRRGRGSKRYTVTEPAPADAVPVLRKYMAQIRVTRPYFDAAPDSPDDAIKAELPRHPVFQLTPVARPHALAEDRAGSQCGGAVRAGGRRMD